MNELPNSPVRSNEPLPVSGEGSKPKWLTRKVYGNDTEKRRDFWLGFGLWFGLNILLVVAQNVLSFVLVALADVIDSSTALDVYPMLNVLGWGLSILSFVLNIGLLIYFWRTRIQFALGMMTAFSAMLALTLVLGMVTSVGCFVVSWDGGESAMYAIVGQVIVAALLIPSALLIGIFALIFRSHYRSNQDVFSRRVSRVLGFLLVVFLVLSLVLTIGYVITLSKP